ncbi:hypothetical protein [Streptomyces sp. NPDC020983]|uniref:hypothetical protein n=1 Tax=Streptomyces sp. NPDC020983 TaxID=3365106 RepID=UPI0037B81209
MSGEHEHAEVAGRAAGRAAGRGDGMRRLVIGAAVAAVLAAGAGAARLAVSAVGGGPVHPVAPVEHTPYARSDPGVTFPAPALPARSGPYRLTGTLPDDVPGPTPLYRPAAAGPDRAAVVRLATALGLTGPAVEDHGSWWVGARDGTGPALMVAADAPGTWSYARNGQSLPGPGTIAPPAKPKVPPPARDGSGSYRATPVAPGTVIIPSDRHEPVGERQAKAAAAPVLDALGLSGAEVDASRTAGASRTVTADPVVGGLPTSGWETGFSVAMDGHLVSAHGHLARLVAGGPQQVTGARRAFDELPEPQAVHPGGSACRSEPVTDAGAAGTACPATPGAPGVPVDVSGARFGLSPQFLPGGGQALVPSWLFTATAEGSHTPYVIARPALG